MITATFMNYQEGTTANTPTYVALQMRYGEIVCCDGEEIASQNKDGMWVYGGEVYTDVVFVAVDS